MGGGAARRPAIRHSTVGGRDPGARGPRLPGELQGPVLLLQARAVDSAHRRSARPRPRRCVRRHDCGRSARASSGACGGRSGGHPLAEAGMTKVDGRAAARTLGLPIWDAPAAPCLSSRVAYGLAITPSRLQQVEVAESYLRSLGVPGDLRVRHHGDRARIEAEPAWIPWLAHRIAQVSARFRALGFEAVEIDPRGYRRGSLL